MAFGTPVAGTAVYSGIGNAINAVVPSGVAAGDALVLVIGHKPSSANVNTGSASTPAGFTERLEIIAAGGYGTSAGVDIGNCNLFIFTKDVVDGSESGTTISSALTGTSAAYGLVIHIPGGGTPLLYSVADGEQSTAPSSTLSVNLAPTIPFKSGDFALWAMAIPTDLTTPALYSAHTISATGATFNTPVEFTEPDTTTNNDLGGVIAYATVASGIATAAPVIGATLSGTLTNVRGPVGLLRITESEAAGSVAHVEPLDTSSATGTNLVDGSVAHLEPIDTSNVTATLLVSGSVAYVSVADTSTADGTVSSAGTTGTVAYVGERNTSSASGTVLVVGSVAHVEPLDTSTAAGVPLVSGSVAHIEPLDTANASGRPLVSGSVASTTQRNTTNTVGTVSIVGSASASQLAATSTASGTVSSTGTTGSAAVTQAVSTSTAVGTLLVAGLVSSTQQSATSSSVGTVRVLGTSTANQVSATASSIGTVRVLGSSANTQGRDTTLAVGSVLVDGSVEETQLADTSSVVGIAPSYGTLDYTDVANAISASGYSSVIGSVEYTEKRDTAYAQGIGLISSIDFSRQQFAMLSQAYYYHTNVESNYYV